MVSRYTVVFIETILFLLLIILHDWNHLLHVSVICVVCVCVCVCTCVCMRAGGRAGVHVRGCVRARGCGPYGAVVCVWAIWCSDLCSPNGTLWF